MQTIRFLLDRLNSEPVVFRGVTTHEMGQLAVHHDPLGSETRWQYNLLGQLVSITDRIQRTRRYHYNCRGWLTRLENGNGADYQFSHDAVGRLMIERRPDSIDRLYRYGLDGQLTEYREVASRTWHHSCPRLCISSVMTTPASWSGALTTAPSGITTMIRPGA